MYGGEVYEYPLARVQIQTPYLSGNVIVVCMEKPVYEVIIGNITRATMLHESMKLNTGSGS